MMHDGNPVNLKNYLNILQENPEVRKIFPDGSIIVANKRCKNLKELLARADPYDVREDLLPNPAGGYKICGKKCDSCNNMVDSTSEFVCSGKSFNSTTFDLPNSEYSLPSILYKVWFTGSGLDSEMESKIGKL